MGLKDIFNIKDKTVLITGAGGWLGKAMVEALKSCGAKVLAIGRKDADFYNIDNWCSFLLELAVKERIDVLINNAYDLSPRTGFNCAEGQLENFGLPSSEYDKNKLSFIWLNSFKALYATAKAIQIIGKQMITDGVNGSIINISSMYGLVAPDPTLYEDTEYFNPPTYATMKAGLIGLTRYTASFWGKHGIRCNAICPGAFPNTEKMNQNKVARPDDKFLYKLSQRTCLGRVGNPQELVGAVVFLASDASSYMTGQILVVDGGWTIR